MVFKQVGRALGSFGGLVRRIADFGGHVARKLGDFAAPVGGIAASAADLLGRPDIAAVISKGAGWISSFAPKAEAALSKVGAVGSGIQNISNRLL